MTFDVWVAAATALYVIAAAGLCYTLLALWAVNRYRPGTTASLSDSQPISILQPLCGAEPRLYESMKSLLEQDYPDTQIIWGVRDGNDPAVEIANRLAQEFPHRRTSLIIDARIHGANLKVSNLRNMLPSAEHGILLIADSDVMLPPDMISRLVASLTQPGTGAVTATYTGIADGTLASRLGALFINDWFMPSALVDLALNGPDGCYGPITAIHRHVLEEIGGLEALSDYLAEDNRMGRLVREKGYTLHVETLPVPTMVYEAGMADLLRHELRWARTVRSCRAFDHALQMVTFPLPMVIALAAVAGSPAGWGFLALHVASRQALHVLVRRRIPGSGPFAPWAVPVRECLCFLVWAISLVGNRISWRGHKFHLTSGGCIIPVDSLHRDALAAIDSPLLVGEEAQ